MTPPNPINNAVIIARLDSLACDMAEIKAQLKESLQSSNKFRIDYEVRQAAIESKATAAHLRLDEHTIELKELADKEDKTEQIVAALAFQAKIVSWIGGILMSSIIVLIWGILTGQVRLTF